jgi:hypothetical protein
MARTEIPVYAINRDAFTPLDGVNGDLTNGMFFSGNAGYTWLEIENPGTATVQVGAMLAQSTIDGITVPDKIVDVAPGTEIGYHFGPFPKIYNHNNTEVWIDIDPDALSATEGTALIFRAYNLLG